MTALAGFVAFNADPGMARRQCNTMLDAQARYANKAPIVMPFDQGALGLATYHQDPGLKQATAPITDVSGRYTLAADIVIHDRQSWIARLGLDRAAARQLSDAALLLKGWERWQAECLAWLNADFAFVLWDRERQELILARDYLGQKPLFYHRHKNWVACASMPAGLLALDDIPHAPDHDALADYISIAPPHGHRWFFEGVQRLPPGKLVIIGPDTIAELDHWPPSRTHLSLPTPEAYIEAAEDIFDRAVKARLGDNDVVGCHLSAGLDSAGVMASAARQCGEGRQIVGFTAVPPEGFAGEAPPGRLLNEGVLAAQSAAVYANVDHVQVLSAGDGLADAWDRAFTLYQAPLPNPCNFPWIAAINYAAQDRGIRRMLSGQIGNYSFSYGAGGYFANLLATGRLVSLIRHFTSLHANGMTFRTLIAKTLLPLASPRIRRSLARLRGRPARLADIHFAGANADGRGDETALYRAADLDSWAERVHVLKGLDFGVYNKGYLAGWGIDMRDPTADRELMEFCLSIPDEVFWHDGQDRGLARAMLKDRLPASVVTERRRGYQAADWRQALRRDNEVLSHEVHRARNSVMSGEVLDLEHLKTTLDSIGDDHSLGQKDELKLRRGLLRAVNAAHFIRLSSGGNY